MKDVLNIGIATTSEAKIEGIRIAFEHFFPETKIEIYSERTQSGVSSQPFGKETSKGALNRLINLVNILKDKGIIVDYYVSCEAGIDNESIVASRLYVYIARNLRKIFLEKVVLGLFQVKIFKKL